jgi:hypothetical protein
MGSAPNAMLQSNTVLGHPALSIGNCTGKVVYGAGKWVLLGTNTKYKYSSDGVTWLEGNTPATGLNKLFFINNLFFAIGGSCQIYTSTDGLAWTSRSTATTAASPIDLFYENGRYFMTGVSGYMTSTDAVSWTAVTTNGAYLRGVKYFGGKYWASNSNGSGGLRYSSDGLTWTIPTTIAGITNTGIYSYDMQIISGVLFALGGGVTYTSVDGTNWSYKNAMAVSVYTIPNRGTIDTAILQHTKLSYAVK